MLGVVIMISTFNISLTEIEPEIFRVVEVPADYSFWDLHVAIQDSMGWLDYHLHQFTPQSKGATPIGIPESPQDETVDPGWDIPISAHYSRPGDSMGYIYDFGDGWHHIVTLTAIADRINSKEYPNCVGGKRACPPEDCGGVPGYYRLLEIISNPRHEERNEMIDWLKSHAKNYYPFDPNAFDPMSVQFYDPQVRWEAAFSNPVWH
jgi:hypothetical protein